jgi:truncated hemoglobin YjbI
LSHSTRSGRDGEITRLVDAFDDRGREDGLLGPIFNDVARVEWAAHLPRMYDCLATTSSKLIRSH